MFRLLAEGLELRLGDFHYRGAETPAAEMPLYWVDNTRGTLFTGRLLTSRRVDALLGLAALSALATGFASWAVGTGWGRAVVVVHAVAGLSLLALAPLKLRGSARTGFRRRRPSRWLSTLMGALVLAVITLGVLHATGLWHGVGYWSALWTHVLLAVLAALALLWHVFSRPSRPRIGDLDRRTFIGGGAAAAAAALAYAGQESVTDNRRFTGSHEIASFNPDAMPTVQWLNDKAPTAPEGGWELTVAGESVMLEHLRRTAQPVEADLDCTGGWWSRQKWDAVPLSDLLNDHGARSVEITSATGYSRLFPARDAPNLYLAVGYGGRPLRRGHGAPVRLVAPGRRGFWWVKWVTRIEPSDRPWWLQLPFPLE